MERETYDNLQACAPGSTALSWYMTQSVQLTLQCEMSLVLLVNHVPTAKGASMATCTMEGGGQFWIVLIWLLGTGA